MALPPFRFFTGIISLLTLVAVLAPFMTDARLATKLATAAIGLVTGVAIGSLVSGAAGSATRRSRQVPRPPRALELPLDIGGDAAVAGNWPIEAFASHSPAAGYSPRSSPRRSVTAP